MRSRFLRTTMAGLIALAAIPTPAPAMTAVEFNEAGKAAYARGDFATAERMFDKAITGDPSQPLFHYHRGVVLVRVGRISEARVAYENALRLNAPAPLAVTIRDALRGIGRGEQSGRARDAASSDAIKLEASGGVWFTEVTLNGTRKARFLVDTGATFCSISPELAQSLGIVVSDDAPVVQLATANGLTTGRLVKLSSIRVGDIEASDVPTVVKDLGVSGTRMEGILGNSFLGRYAVTLDAQRGVLHLTNR
jgi:clan AA aspartic protease (TIGR02281 family)